MTDSVGEDGYVRLRVYDATSTYLSVTCRGCGRLSTLSITKAIRLTSSDRTVGQLAKRLRCDACGQQKALLNIAVDVRPHDLREREGPLPQVMDDQAWIA
jgi:hypothetical protein